jgi:hypothetical protein
MENAGPRWLCAAGSVRVVFSQRQNSRDKNRWEDGRGYGGVWSHQETVWRGLESDRSPVPRLATQSLPGPWLLSSRQLELMHECTPDG